MLCLMMLVAACQTSGTADDKHELVTAKQNKEPASDKSETELPDIPTDDMVLWVRPETVVAEGGHVVRWEDVSNQRNHLDAPGESPRPTFVSKGAGGLAAARFDGTDDMLLRDGFTPEQIPAATIFVVAAPAENSGEGDGFVSAGRRGDDDFWTGFGVGMGRKLDPDCSSKFPDSLHEFNTVNAQSPKRDSDCGDDLLETSTRFGRPAVLTVRLGGRDTTLRFNGEPQRRAAGGGETLLVPQFRVGARYHHQRFQGFYKGTISEIIVYQSALSDETIETVEGYLIERYRLDS